MSSIFERPHLFPRDIAEEVRHTLEARCFADKEVFIEESEALCLLLGDKRFHSRLPEIIPGVGGPRKLTFTPTRSICLGSPDAITRPVLLLVLNDAEYADKTTLDVPDLVDRILTAAAELVAQDPLKLYPTEPAKRAALAALIGDGDREIILDPKALALPTSAPAPSPEKGASISAFLQALTERQTVAEAAVTAGYISAGFVNTALGIMELKQRLQSRKKPPVTGPQQNRKRVVRARGYVRKRRP